MTSNPLVVPPADANREYHVLASVMEELNVEVVQLLGTHDRLLEVNDQLAMWRLTSAQSLRNLSSLSVLQPEEEDQHHDDDHGLAE
jgi:hypothetical protein